MAARSLIVMPDDTGKPILDAIEAAQESIRIKIFLFSEPTLLAAVIAAHQRGVMVRVMLNPARRSGERALSSSRSIDRAVPMDRTWVVRSLGPSFGALDRI